MRKRFVLVSTVVSILIMLLMLNFTTPTGVGPLGVLVFFTTFYIALFGVITVMMFVGRKMLGQREGMRGKDYLYVAVLAFGPVLLLIARGFLGVSLATVGLAAVAVILGCFLVHKKA